MVTSSLPSILKNQKWFVMIRAVRRHLYCLIWFLNFQNNFIPYFLKKLGLIVVWTLPKKYLILQANVTSILKATFCQGVSLCGSDIFSCPGFSLLLSSIWHCPYRPCLLCLLFYLCFVLRNFFYSSTSLSFILSVTVSFLLSTHPCVL